MTDDALDFFDELAARERVPELEKLSGTIRFDIVERSGRPTRCLVSIEKGEVRVSRSNATADCVVRVDRALFHDLASGRANALSAVLRGAMTVEGDAALLLPFQRLFAPPAAGA